MAATQSQLETYVQFLLLSILGIVFRKSNNYNLPSISRRRRLQKQIVQNHSPFLIQLIPHVIWHPIRSIAHTLPMRHISIKPKLLIKTFPNWKLNVSEFINFLIADGNFYLIGIFNLY